MRENGFQVVAVLGGGITFDGENLLDAAASVPALDVDQEINGIGDAGFDRLVWQLNAALENATYQPGKCLTRGIGMNGGKASAVAGVEGLQQIESFLAPYLPQDGALGPVPQAGLEQVADCNGRDLRSLLAAGLEADKVRLADVDFGSVLDDQQAVIVGNEIGQDVEQGGFPCAGASADEDVLSIQDGRLEIGGHLLGNCPDANQVMDSEAAGIEFADGERDSLNAARRQDGGYAAAVRQPGVEDGFFLGDVIAEGAGDVLNGNPELVGRDSHPSDFFENAMLLDKDVAG